MKKIVLLFVLGLVGCVGPTTETLYTNCYDNQILNYCYKFMEKTNLNDVDHLSNDEIESLIFRRKQAKEIIQKLEKQREFVINEYLQTK